MEAEGQSQTSQPPPLDKAPQSDAPPIDASRTLESIPWLARNPLGALLRCAGEAFCELAELSLRSVTAARLRDELRQPPTTANDDGLSHIRGELLTLRERLTRAEEGMDSSHFTYGAVRKDPFRELLRPRPPRRIVLRKTRQPGGAEAWTRVKKPSAQPRKVVQKARPVAVASLAQEAPSPVLRSHFVDHDYGQAAVPPPPSSDFLHLLHSQASPEAPASPRSGLLSPPFLLPQTGRPSVEPEFSRGLPPGQTTLLTVHPSDGVGGDPVARIVISRDEVRVTRLPRAVAPPMAIVEHFPPSRPRGRRLRTPLKDAARQASGPSTRRPVTEHYYAQPPRHRHSEPTPSPSRHQASSFRPAQSQDRIPTTQDFFPAAISALPEPPLYPTTSDFFPESPQQSGWSVGRCSGGSDAAAAPGASTSTQGAGQALPQASSSSLPQSASSSGPLEEEAWPEPSLLCAPLRLGDYTDGLNFTPGEGFFGLL